MKPLHSIRKISVFRRLTPAALLLLFSALLYSQAAAPAAQVNASIQSAAAGQLIYSDASGNVESLVITLRYKGVTGPYFLTFSKGSSPTFTTRTVVIPSGDPLVYQIYDAQAGGNILKDLTATPSQNEVLPGTFVDSNKWRTDTKTVYLRTEPGQLPMAGTGTDTITVSLYTGTVGSAGSPVDTMAVTVTGTVGRITDMSITDTNAAFFPRNTSRTIDLDNLFGTVMKEGDIMVRANGNYTLELSSGNGGILRHVSDPSESFPYTFVIDTETASFSAGPWSSAVGTATQPAGRRYHFTARAGLPPAFPAEGSYQDNITVTVTAR